MTWDTTTVPDGPYTLRCVAYNAMGNAATSAGVPVVVDNTPPSATLTVPASGASLKGDQALDCSASDSGGVAGVTFRLTGGSFSDALIATGTLTYYGWIATWDTATVPDGAYQVNCDATDTAGNIGVSAGVPVGVHNPVTITTTGLPNGSPRRSIR